MKRFCCIEKRKGRDLMKKFLAFGVAATLMITVAGCGSSPGNQKGTEDKSNGEKEPVTIEFFCWGSAEAATSEAFDNMISGFEEKYPWITVEVTESNYDSVSKTLLTRAAGQDAPDVAQVSDQWVAAFYEMDALLAMDDILPEEAVADFYEGSKEGTTIDGKLYSAPWILQPMCMYYNKDLLEKAGYDNPPETWDEYIDACYGIAELGTDEAGNTIYGRSFASTVLVGAGYFSLMDIWANGGAFSDADGNITFDSPETIAAYEEIQEMVKEGVIAPGLQIVDNRSLFGNGQIGFHFDAPSQTATFSEVNFGVAPVPGGQTFSSSHHLVGFKQTEHPDEVALFIDYLTGPEGMKLYTDSSDVIAARYTSAELEYFQNLDENMSVFNAAAADVRSLPIYSSHFSEAMEDIAEGLQRIIIGMEDVPTVVEEIDGQLKELYE